MVDPGGVIGAVSLALQVIQGLNAYYTQFKSYNEDIDAVLSRTNRLHSILRILERPLLKLETDDDPVSEEVWACIAQCLKVVKKLNVHQEKCSREENAKDTLRTKMHEVRNRTAYPFRKHTMDDMQKLLDRMLENLAVILQACHLYVCSSLL